MDASHADSFDINQTNNSVLEWSNRVVGQDYDFDLVGATQPESLPRVNGPSILTGTICLGQPRTFIIIPTKITLRCPYLDKPGGIMRD